MCQQNNKKNVLNLKESTKIIIILNIIKKEQKPYYEKKGKLQEYVQNCYTDFFLTMKMRRPFIGMKEVFF